MAIRQKSYSILTSPTNCLHCGDPIAQPRAGGRPRRYCDKPKCRKAGNRAVQKLKKEMEEQQVRDSLRLKWHQRYDAMTIAMLEQILYKFGIDAASMSTQALEREMDALIRLADTRNRVAASEGK